MWKSRSNLFLGPSLTDDGKIELLSDGIEQVKKAHAAGRNVLVEVDGREVLLEASASPSCRWG